MNIIESLINSHLQVTTMLVYVIILWAVSFIGAMLHGIEMAFWFFKQELIHNHVRKGMIVFKEALFGILLLSIVHVLLLYVMHTSNIGDKARFEMGVWQYVGVFVLGISLYPFLIWKVFRKNTQSCLVHQGE